MKRFLFAALGFLALAFAAPEALAQAQTQQLGTRLDAGGYALTQNGTAQQTASITAGSGQYVYVTGIDFTNCSSGSAGAAGTPVFATSTNLGGAKWGLPTSIPAGSCVQLLIWYNPPLKSTAQGGVASITSPAAETNVTYNVNIYGYSAN